MLKELVLSFSLFAGTPEVIKPTIIQDATQVEHFDINAYFPETKDYGGCYRNLEKLLSEVPSYDFSNQPKAGSSEKEYLFNITLETRSLSMMFHHEINYLGDNKIKELLPYHVKILERAKEAIKGHPFTNVLEGRQFEAVNLIFLYEEKQESGVSTIPKSLERYILPFTRDEIKDKSLEDFEKIYNKLPRWKSPSLSYTSLDQIRSTLNDSPENGEYIPPEYRN